MRTVRLQNGDVIYAPWWLKYRLLILLAAPVIAGAVTIKIMASNRLLVRKFWRVLPGIFLTKLAWCRGASYQSLDALN